MAFMARIKADDGVRLSAEYINYLFSVPASIWTGCLETMERAPISWVDAFEEMCGIPIRLEAARQRFKIERYATDRILVAQQESRYGYRLAVLAHQPYRIIEVRPGSFDRASVVIWEDIK